MNTLLFIVLFMSPYYGPISLGYASTAEECNTKVEKYKELLQTDNIICEINI